MQPRREQAGAQPERIALLQADRSGVHDQIDIRDHLLDLARVQRERQELGLRELHFTGDGCDPGEGAVGDDDFRRAFEGAFHGDPLPRPAGAEHEHAFAFDREIEIFLDRLEEAVAVGVEPAQLSLFDGDRVDGSQPTSFGVNLINALQGRNLVWHGEVDADHAHVTGAVQRATEILWLDMEGEIPPVHFQCVERRIVHRGRRRVRNGRSEHTDNRC